jgi:hypothetical protein
MANPNIVNVSVIYGNTSSLLISSTSNPFATALASNANGSNTVFKINTVTVANVDPNNSATISIQLFAGAGLTGANTAVASTIVVPGASSLVVIDKNTSLYLLENRSLGATANVANRLVVTTSWDEIS